MESKTNIIWAELCRWLININGGCNIVANVMPLPGCPVLATIKHGCSHRLALVNFGVWACG